MKKTLLKNIYKFDEKKQEYVIDISINHYQELFNDWDASPTWKKDLDPGLIVYLEASSFDIPKKNSISINFSLPLDKKDQNKENRALKGINNHFITSLYFTKLELKYNLRKILYFIILGFTFITIAYLIQNQIIVNLGFDILIEGVYIGGWVLLWEAFSLFFFSMHSIRKRKSMYLRFLNSKIFFIYQ